MSAAEVDAYLESAPEPQRSTLQALRAIIVGILPEAEQGISYGVPAFRVNGRGVAGFASYAQHCTYLPMSGSITAQLAEELTGYVTAKGSVRFATDQPLPEDLVRALIDARLAEIQRTGR